MSNIPQSAESPLPIVDRRLSVRQPVPSLAYVDLGENNGGIIMNLGEGGLAVTLAAPMYSDRPARMRFQLPGSWDWLEANGEVARISESRKEAGLRFVNLSEDARIRIKEWVLAASAGLSPRETAPAESDETSGAWPARTPTRATVKLAPPEQVAPDEALGPVPVAEPDSRSEEFAGRRLPREEQFAKDNLDQTRDTLRDFDRRVHVRRAVPSLAYVDLGENNGGVILNIGEGGIALTSAAPLFPGVPIEMRFQLPGSNDWLEARGEIAQISGSKKEAGLRFVNLSEDARNQIQDWISSDISAAASKPEEARSREKAWRRLEMPIIGVAGSLPAQPAGTLRVVQKNAHQLMSQPNAASTPINTRKWAAASAPTDLSPTVLGRISNQTGAEAGDGWRQFLLRWRLWAALALALFLGAFLAGWFTAGPGPITRLFARHAESGSGTSETASTTEPAPASSVATVPSTAPARSGELVPASKSAITRSSSAQVARSPEPASQPGPVSAAASVPESAPPQAPDNVAPPVQQTSATASPSPSVSEPGAPPAAGATEHVSSPPVKPVETPEIAKSSVSLSFAPYPSIRVPAGLKPQTSQKGMALQIGQLLSRVDPVYPEDATTQHIEGSVTLHAVIARDGTMESVETRSGPALLVPAAVGAVRQWRFTPSSIGGQPVEAEQDITITFKLPGQTTHSN
jgi:TonB family protein